MLTDEGVLHPIDEPMPERTPNQNDRNPAAFAGLHQCQALGQLIQRAEAARQHDIRGSPTDEHHLAREEIAEVETHVLESVSPHLVRQQDIEADGRRLAGERTAVRGFHEPRTAAGDHGESSIRQ